MEFYTQGKLMTSWSKEYEESQISYLHCLGSLYTVVKYLESNGKNIDSKWDNVPKWIYGSFDP